MGRIAFNVSGQHFTTTTETLSRFPETKLGLLVDQKENDEELFFDANEHVFKEVLRYYRTGELHAPPSMCAASFNKELEFWGLSNAELELCCQSTEISDSELEKQFLCFRKRIELNREPTFKDRVWYFLTDPIGPYTTHKRLAIAWCWLYAILVVIQISFIAVTTLPRMTHLYTNSTNGTYSDVIKMQAKHPCAGAKNWAEILQTETLAAWYMCSGFFIIEIFIRFISCPNKKTFYCSLHLLDAAVALMDTLQYLISLPYMYVMNNYKFNTELCVAVTVINAVSYFTSQLRCFRLLVFCTNSR